MAGLTPEEAEATWEQNQELVRHIAALEQDLQTVRGRNRDILAELLSSRAEAAKAQKYAGEAREARRQLEEMRQRLAVAEQARDRVSHERDEAASKGQESACEVAALRAELSELQRHCGQLHGLAGELRGCLEAEQRAGKLLRTHSEELEALLKAQRPGEEAHAEHPGRCAASQPSGCGVSLGDELASSRGGDAADFFSFLDTTGRESALTDMKPSASLRATRGRAGAMSNRLEELQQEWQHTFSKEKKKSADKIAKKDRAIKRLKSQLAELRAESTGEPAAFSGIVDTLMSQLSELTAAESPRSTTAASATAHASTDGSIHTTPDPAPAVAPKRVSRVRVRLQARRERQSVLAASAAAVAAAYL